MKKVLVTGASKGIGEAIANRYLQEGYYVIGTYNTGKEGAAKLQEKHKNLEFIKCDFTDDEELKSLIEKLKNHQFSIIVNNAGMIEFEEFESFNFPQWKDTFQVNLFAPLYLSVMLQNQLEKNASIVNISSLDGLVGSFSSMAYSASKAALINLTKSLGNNFGLKGVRVNALAPGWIDTGMSTEESYTATSLTPLGRNGTPDEVADLVYYLTSEKASFINGETIIIDGGYGNVDYIMLQEAQSMK